MGRLEATPLDPDTADRTRTLGRADVATVSAGNTTVTREVMHPGWRWSVDIRPIVRTDLCRARHQMYVVSGRMQIVMSDTDLVVGAGDAVVVAPGHDAWVVGDEPCEIVDFSSDYSDLIDAGEAYRELTASRRGAGDRRSWTDAAATLRRDARAGRLGSGAVEVVLTARGHRSGPMSGPAGLTARETQVLALIATGASAKQVAHVLGITPKTAATHIERIYAKTAVSNRAAATRFAIRYGIVDLPH